MKPSDDLTIYKLDPSTVRVLVHRDRDQAEFALSVEDVKLRAARGEGDGTGQLEPGEVRDIREIPKEERRREGGGFYDYELIAGEGRLLRAKAARKPFRAYVVKRSDVDAVGRFLSENLNRVELPALQKARLLKFAVDAGMSVKQIAKEHSLDPAYVSNLVATIGRLAPGMEAELDQMTVNEARELASLSTEHQKMVIEVFREVKPAHIREMIKQAKTVERQDSGLTVEALKKSLQRIDDDLRAVREELKPLRRDWAIGPMNILTLLKNKAFVKATTEEGISFEKFKTIIQ